MGLASSQARLLTLTARQHEIEYKAQRLEAMKLQLANDSDQVYNEYMRKLDATKIQYKIIESDGSIRFDNATFAKLTGKFLFNVNGTICKDLTEVKKAVKDQKIISDEKGELTASDSYTLLTTLVSEGIVVLMQVSDEPESGWEYDASTGTVTEIQYRNPETGNVEKTYSQTDSSADGNFSSVLDGETDAVAYKVFKDTSVSTSTLIQEVSDEKELKKAEAEYEANMNRINKKDTRYDTELSQLETERNAIKEEIETLKTVAKDNVDRTFKIFG